MPINKNYICVFDFETSSPDQYITQPLELASIMIHPRTLEIVEGSEFQSFIRPQNIFKEVDGNLVDTGEIDWSIIQDGALRVGGKTDAQVEEYKRNIEKAPSKKYVFESFCEYLKKYKTGKNQWGNPIPAGRNIVAFDLPIIYRLCKEFGKVDKNDGPLLFHPIHFVDGQNIDFLWYEDKAYPEKLNFDYMRGFYGLPTDNAHRALTDVIQTAQVICRFMQFYRKQSLKTKFEGAFRGV